MNTKKHVKISATVARALAEEVIEKVNKAVDKEAKEIQEQVRNSKEVKKLRSLNEQIKALQKEYHAVQNSIESKHSQKFRVYLSNHKGLEISIMARHVSLDAKTVKNAIIVASHIEGIAYDKLVEHAVAKFKP